MGLITFIGTSTHMSCYATVRSHLAVPRVRHCYATVRSLALPHICHDLDHDDDFGDEDDDDDQDDDDDHDHDHDEHDEILKLILMLKLETMLVMKSFVIGPFHFPPDE